MRVPRGASGGIYLAYLSGCRSRQELDEMVFKLIVSNSVKKASGSLPPLGLLTVEVNAHKIRYQQFALYHAWLVLVAVLCMQGGVFFLWCGSDHLGYEALV
jgi:hypothetical protein